jgi:hypothetical protein
MHWGVVGLEAAGQPGVGSIFHGRDLSYRSYVIVENIGDESATSADDSVEVVDAT